MVSYSVHLPAQAAIGDPAAIERLVVVRDGFSVFAFAFHVFWMLRHRLWLAALGVLVLVTGTGLATDAAGLPGAAAFAIQLLVSLLIGLEASSLRRWTLRRNGLPMRDVVVADSVDEAEDKAIARWLAAAPAYPGPMPAAPARGSVSAYPAPSSVPVIGLFPQPGGRA